eukprot:Tbor_TRINITY_DN5811_c4_g1::TRINITY_DN5811_c4_g1_i3::g.6952::m.6952
MAPPKTTSSSKCTSSKPQNTSNITQVPTSRVAVVKPTGGEPTTPCRNPPIPKTTPSRICLSSRIPPQVPTSRPDSTHGSPSVCRGQFRPLRSNEVGHYRKDHKLGVPAFEDALKAAGIDINRKREKIQIASHRGDICYDDGLVCSRDGSPQQPYHYPPNETLPCSKLFPYTEPTMKLMNSPERYESNYYGNRNNNNNTSNNVVNWPYDDYYKNQAQGGQSYNNNNRITPFPMSPLCPSQRANHSQQRHQYMYNHRV